MRLGVLLAGLEVTVCTLVYGVLGWCVGGSSMRLCHAVECAVACSRSLLVGMVCCYELLSFQPAQHFRRAAYLT